MNNSDFTQQTILEDETAILRPLQITDVEHLKQFSLTEPDLWKYSMVQAIGEQGLKDYIAAAIQGREEQREYPFIVFDKRTGSYAGCTRFYDIQVVNSSLQLGYTWYGKDFQGTGLNKHCKFLMLEFAFEHLGVERVEFRADNDNKRSIASMKSLGCTVEGILRSNGVRKDGSRRDSIVLSILKEEWQTKVKENLRSKLT